MGGISISTGELCMANRYGQTFADLMREKINAFRAANAEALPETFTLRPTVGVAPMTSDLEGHLHSAFNEVLAAIGGEK